MSCGKLSIGELDGLSDKESAEKVAERFAVVSQEYTKLDREDVRKVASTSGFAKWFVSFFACVDKERYQP